MACNMHSSWLHPHLLCELCCEGCTVVVLQQGLKSFWARCGPDEQQNLVCWWRWQQVLCVPHGLVLRLVRRVLPVVWLLVVLLRVLLEDDGAVGDLSYEGAGGVGW